MAMLIAGLLLAILVPQFMQKSTAAKIAQTKAGLEELRTAIALCYAKLGRYPSGGEQMSLYLDVMPADGFKNRNNIIYGMDLCGRGYIGDPGGWCYAGDGRGGKIYPNLPSNQAEYDYEDFSKY
jgi:hypothetical protein